KAPMPGKLVRVLVAAGDEVVAGQGLVVVEAMKMENELRAPRAGRVKELPAREGQAVEAGGLLRVLGSAVRRRRRRFLLFLLLLATLGLFLVRLPQWAAAIVAQQLSGSFGRPVSVGSVGFRLLPLEVELLEIRVSALEPDDPPTIEIPRVLGAPSLAPLRGRRLVLSRVRLEGPRIHIHAFPDPPRGPGGDDIPRLGGGSGGGLDVSINRLVIQGGEFSLDHERVPLDLDLPDFH